MRTRILRPLLSARFWIILLSGLVLCASCRSTPPETTAVDNLPAIRVTGQRSLGSKALKAIVAGELRDAIGHIHTRAAVDDSAFAIEEHYHGLGFPEVEVTYTWSEPEEAPPMGLAQFQVHEGPRLSIGKFRFEGNHNIESKSLAALFEGPTTGALGTGRKIYDEARVNSFSNGIEDLYFERGYLDVHVAHPTITWNTDRTLANPLYAIDEGERYRLREVRVVGASNETNESLVALAQPFLNEAFVPSVLYEVRGQLIAHLGEEGYPTVTLEGERLAGEEPSDVVLSYTVQTGPRVRVRSVEIVGQERTRTSTVRKLVALRAGDWYSLSAKRESFDALYGSGLFETVKLTMKDLRNGEATWLVELQESSSGEIFIEPGYGSYERLRVRMGVKEGNLFGLGHLARANITLGFIAQEAEIGYTNPHFTSSNLELDISTYWTRREEPSFLRKELGSGATLTHRFDAQDRLIMGHHFRNSRATELEVTDPETLADAETVNVSSITLTPTHDSRAGVFAPSDGTLARFILEYAGSAIGSEIDFVRMSAHWATYFPVRQGTIFAGAIRTGAIIPTGETDGIPIQERFFNGGESTVRSFKQDELGPVDANNNPIGGETFTVLSAELRQELVGTFQVAAFADTGNLVEDSAEYFKFEGFRHALGVGVRYLLPIGPLRLDWGWNPNPQNEEETWVLHLSVGMAF